MGVVSIWMLPFLFGPVALALSIISHNRIHQSPHLKGKGAAWMGLLLGFISTVWAAIQFSKG